MPQINMEEYNNAVATSTDSRPRMGAGGYECEIQVIRINGTDSSGRVIDYIKEKQYVVPIFDVIAGEHAGRYSDEYWLDPSRDWGHRFYWSWKNMGAFKNVINCFDESNPGFDAMAAFTADNWDLFKGKKIGLVFGEEEYRANDGSIKTRLTLPSVRSIQAIREGRYKVPELKRLEGAAPSTAAPADAASSIYNDVPFF